MLRSPQKAVNRVSTITIFLSKLKKQILQLIVNYDVMSYRKEVKFVEFSKSGTGFRSSQKPRSSIPRCDF